MKTKRLRKTVASKTSILVMLETLEKFYEETRGDPALAEFASLLWLTAENGRAARTLAHEVMIEKQSGASHDAEDERDTGGVWAPLSGIPHYGAFKQ